MVILIHKKKTNKTKIKKMRAAHPAQTPTNLDDFFNNSTDSNNNRINNPNDFGEFDPYGPKKYGYPSAAAAGINEGNSASAPPLPTSLPFGEVKQHSPPPSYITNNSSLYNHALNTNAKLNLNISASDQHVNDLYYTTPSVRH